VREPDAAGGDFQFVGAGGKPVVRVHLKPAGEPVTVGRASGNRISIDHASVSKFHATVSMAQDGRLFVADLGSTNGTFVNGEKEPVSGAHAVEPGDTIVFGEIPFTVERA
jgi:pSer/pThr/pTyr-binding forkhead associated (FHA) protein